jgi:hypothetical protein
MTKIPFIKVSAIIQRFIPKKSKSELNFNIKDDNELQLIIMEKAGIPKKEMPNYALSSVADGRILRDYINEVKSGEITIEEAVKKVQNDYEKMKSGRKEGKFVTPLNSEQNDSSK